LVSPLVTGSTDSERITPFQSRAATLKLPYHAHIVEVKGPTSARAYVSAAAGGRRVVSTALLVLHHAFAHNLIYG
jgi:hypothetical protein